MLLAVARRLTPEVGVSLRHHLHGNDPPHNAFARNRTAIAQVKNGGVLYVDEGATATFMGTAEFTDNSVAVKQIGPISCDGGCTIGPGISYIIKKGGAIHNKVSIASP